LLAGLLAACARGQAPSPFSASEIDAGLAPVKALRARCYPSSEAARSSRRASLDLSLEIAASGRVRATPTFAEPEDPQLIECLRAGLNELRFAARGRDRIQLHLELTPDSPEKRATTAH
jgi:hypothetical protein